MSSVVIAVTAAAGRTGQAVVRELRAKGFAVRALVRQRDGRSEALARLGAEVVETDLYDAGPMAIAWRQIADTICEKTGRKIRIIPLPGWLARLNQLLATPLSKPAANVFALMSFVASYQPRWNSAEVLRRFDLPKQLTVSDYLDTNYARK